MVVAHDLLDIKARSKAPTFMRGCGSLLAFKAKATGQGVHSSDETALSELGRFVYIDQAMPDEAQYLDAVKNLKFISWNHSCNP